MRLCHPDSRYIGGSFVLLEGDIWFKVGDVVAREKIGSLFWDTMPDWYKYSNKSKVEKCRCKKSTEKKSMESTEEAWLQPSSTSPKTCEERSISEYSFNLSKISGNDDSGFEDNMDDLSFLSPEEGFSLHTEHLEFDTKSFFDGEV